MKSKKLLSALVLIIILVTFVACNSEKKTDSIENEEKDYVEARQDGDFKYDVSFNEVTITRYVGNNTEVIVPDMINEMPVVSIGAKAFSGIDSIKKITLPSTVKKICMYAFFDCISLEEINIENVEEIDQGAFQRCYSLKNINSKEVMVIGVRAFSECSSLKEINIENVKAIGASAFCKCTSLDMDIVFNELTLDNLGANAFLDCFGLDGNTITFKKVNQSEIVEFGVFKNTGVKLVIDSIRPSKYAYLFGNIIEDEFIVFASYSWLGECHNTYSMGYGAGNNEYITVEPQKLCDAINQYFNGKNLKNGESIKLGEIQHILDMMIDDKTTYVHALAERDANKYRFVEQLKMILSGKNPVHDDMIGWDPDGLGLKKDIEYDEGGWTKYTYYPLNKNLELVNTSGYSFEFEVELNEDDGIPTFIIRASMYMPHNQ